MLGVDSHSSEFSLCAWCNDFLDHKRDDNFEEGICQTCLKELDTIPNLELDNIKRDFVDSLPYGNIVLDPNNIVIRYNATESKYTGYEVEKIEGKHFFDEVAPCTKVNVFFGQLQEFRKTGHNNQYLFKFSFINKNFQSLVSILMTYYHNGYVILSIKKIRDLEQ